VFEERRIRREATSELDRVRREVDRLFEQMTNQNEWLGLTQPRTWSPPSDVYETETYFLVRVEIAGMDEEAFDVTFADGVLRIRGTREEPEAPRRAYFQMEIRYGPFAVALRINQPIDADRIEARYESGFLTVTLPKRVSGERRAAVRSSGSVQL